MTFSCSFKFRKSNGCFVNTLLLFISGENTPEASVKFIREMFHQNHPCHKQVYTHVSCATDVEMMSDLLAKVLDIVAEINARRSACLY